jgi:hypothetical protein
MTDEPKGAELPKISVPATRALASAGVTRLEDLTSHRSADLLELHGMGPKASGNYVRPSPSAVCRSATMPEEKSSAICRSGPWTFV